MSERVTPTEIAAQLWCEPKHASKEMDVEFAESIATALRGAGMEPWGTLPAACIDDPDDSLKLHAEGAAVSGAGRVRIGPTPYPARPFDYDEYLARVTDRYAAVVEKVTRPARVRILIETHCGGAAASAASSNTCRCFASACWDS